MICSTEGCSKNLRRDNKTGFCRRHRERSLNRRDYMKAYNATFSEKTVAYKKDHYSANRHRWLEQGLQRNYGITLGEFNALNDAQRGLFAICKGTPSGGYLRLSVDHCHKTGVIRGLLCMHCNSLLGYAKDNSDILKTALRYLGGQNFDQASDNSGTCKSDKDSF